MNERRIERLQEFIKARVAEIVLHDVSDPKLGMVTITRCKLDREMELCRVYWSVIGEQKVRAKNQGALNRARKFIQHELAESLSTRKVPQLRFEFDESIEGAVRVQNIISDLSKEREAREAALAAAAGNTSEPENDSAPQDGTPGGDDQPSPADPPSPAGPPSPADPPGPGGRTDES